MTKRIYGITKVISREVLNEFFAELDYVRIALLFGSRARGNPTPKSDYDFALLFEDSSSPDWGFKAKAWNDICGRLKLADDDIVDFLMLDPNYSEVLIKRIENFSF